MQFRAPFGSQKNNEIDRHLVVEKRDRDHGPRPPRGSERFAFFLAATSLFSLGFAEGTEL